MSSENAYLAFDLGASSGRAVLGAMRNGRLHLHELHRFTTPILEQNGHLFWDLDAVWEELKTGLAYALDHSGNLKSLSVNSWGVDYIPLDADGKPLRKAYCYRDPRVRGGIERIKVRVPPEEIYRITGIQLMDINTLYQLDADWHEMPEMFQRTAVRLTIADYFNFLFCGTAVIEKSLASTTQLMDVHSGEWSAELFEKAGIPASGWPDIVPSGTKLGRCRVRDDDVQVIAGCSHDTADAVAAVPAGDNDNWAYISCGTWSLLGAELKRPLLSKAAFEAGFTNEAGLDDTIRFLKNITGLWVLQECEREWRKTGRTLTYEQLMREAEEADPDVPFIDLNDPAFTDRGGMEDRVRTYCTNKGRELPAGRGALVRAILSSLAEIFSRTLQRLEEVTGRSVEIIHIVGGGAKNRLLGQWTANACGCVVVAGPAEATAAGNVLIQARTMGDLPRGVPVRSVIRNQAETQTFRPSHSEA